MQQIESNNREGKMRKLTVVLLCCFVAVLLTFVVACTSAQKKVDSYADDRSAIEDLQARYMFALDFKDVDAYLSTFTPDGILDIGTGEIKGHDAIRKIIGGMPSSNQAQASKDAAKLRPATGRHNISNIVIKVEGDKASGRAYWFHYGNNNPQRTASLDSYGHYVDEMVKVNGKWLFSKRRIYNEQVAEWAAPAGNPAR
jgi:ketosteroid isomerase-like protein